MKKLLLASLLFVLCVSVAQAQYLIGGRAAGMGGAGVAATDDLAAAYYNPACLMRSSTLVTNLKIDLGAAYSSPDTLSKAISKANDPSKFLVDNYSTNLNFTGNLSGLIGLDTRKIGLSVLPVISNVTVNKPANQLGGTMEAIGHYDYALTLGTTYSLPFLPAALDVGVNLKAINGLKGTLAATQSGTLDATGTQVYGTGAGTGFDIGVLTSFNVPYVTKLAVGAVVRNLSTSYTLSNTTQTATMNYNPFTQTGTTTLSASSTANETVNIASSTAIGAYAVVPVVGLGVAADLEMIGADTNTHIGIEYPMLLDTLFLRAGVASGPNLSLTTLGAELDIRLLKVALVSVQDAKHSGLTTTVADITIGF